jgi:hypothetical protein
MATGMASGPAQYLWPDGTWRKTPAPAPGTAAPKPVTSTPSYGADGAITGFTANTQQYASPSPQPQSAPAPAYRPPTSYQAISDVSQGSSTSSPSQMERTLLASEQPNIRSAATDYASGQSNVSSVSSGIRQNAYEEQEYLKLKAQLARSEFDRRFGMIKGDMDPTEQGAPGGGQDPAGAGDAIFARAKDRQGAIARSSIDALNNVLAERGMAGSPGMVADAAAGVINEGQGELGEVNRDIMLDELERSYQVADRDANNSVVKRGQDISARNALLGVLNAGLY